MNGCCNSNLLQLILNSKSIGRQQPSNLFSLEEKNWLWNHWNRIITDEPQHETLVTRFYIYNLIKQILTFYDNSNFFFFFFQFQEKKKIEFYKLLFCFFYFSSIPYIPTPIPHIPTLIPHIPTPFPTFPPQFPAFLPWFPAFPTFHSFHSPIPQHGFYR